MYIHRRRGLPDLWCFVFFLTLQPSWALAANPPTPYCGIQCVYAAARAYGQQIEFSQLVDRRFVGSYEGSSVPELILAIEETGLKGVPFNALSVEDLYDYNAPILLLLSRPMQEGTLRHWVLLVHADRQCLQILESPGQIQEVSPAELLAQWDGTGILVVRDKVAVGGILDKARTRRWSQSGLFALTAALLALASKPWRPKALVSPRLAGAQAVIVVVIACVTGLAWHLTFSFGLLHNRSAIAFVQFGSFTQKLPSVTRVEVVELLKTKDLVLIDARSPSSFAQGHIDGAINLPAFTTQSALRGTCDRISEGATVIVYCQSDSCEYGDRIGSRMRLLGVKNVSIYKNGWAEWTARVTR